MFWVGLSFHQCGRISFPTEPTALKDTLTVQTSQSMSHGHVRDPTLGALPQIWCVREPGDTDVSLKELTLEDITEYWSAFYERWTQRML